MLGVEGRACLGLKASSGAPVQVCLAIWLVNAARDLTGKFVAIFLPISAFVAMGFEHWYVHACPRRLCLNVCIPACMQRYTD